MVNSQMTVPVLSSTIISNKLTSMPLHYWNGTSRFECNTRNEVEGIGNAPVIIHQLSIGITTVTVIKLIITNSLNLVHTKK